MKAQASLPHFFRDLLVVFRKHDGVFRSVIRGFLSRSCPVWVVLRPLLILNLMWSAVGEGRGATSPALNLMGELGCATCHAGLPVETRLRNLTPDLSSAGLRYNPAYLLEYLQKPSRVHRHLGRARMPDFHLSEAEALALVLFLQEQRQTQGDWPPLPEGVEDPLPLADVSAAVAMPLLRDTGRCLNCHQLDGAGGSVGIELTRVGYRLQQDWLRRYLVAPAMYGVDPGIMPPPFFEHADGAAQFTPLTNDAVRAIQTITSFLFGLNTDRRATLQSHWNRAKADHPLVTAAQGERLFSSLNCAACHRHHRIQPRADPEAPDLLTVGARLKPEWLESYLRKPTPVRPFGFHPGRGSRMPDFTLTDDEVLLLSRYFTRVGTSLSASLNIKFNPAPPSAFAMEKAASLFRDKLSCLGCHAVNGQGGRIAPDLGLASRRLQHGYLRQMIRDPQSVAPHAIMPRPFLSEATGDLLANFILQLKPAEAPTLYLSHLTHPLLPDVVGSLSSSKNIYLTHCAPCHGSQGRGDGFNVPYLPVKPTPHADPSILKRRANDTLFDGIHVGGLILNKNHTMPAWGGTLTPDVIQGLVAYMRDLCQCEQPSWAEEQP